MNDAFKNQYDKMLDQPVLLLGLRKENLVLKTDGIRFQEVIFKNRFDKDLGFH